jgi:hypothetical protein
MAVDERKEVQEGEGSASAGPSEPEALENIAETFGERRMLGWALAYAARSFSVFPCSRRKTPLTSNGLHDATTDWDRITEWWSEHPDANIGIRTGRVSDLAVLDVDGMEGERSLIELEHELPDTWVVITGRGAHFWFRMPEWELRNSASKLGPGLDVRAEGGYVIGPPSVHSSGAEYAFAGERRSGSTHRSLNSRPRGHGSASCVMATATRTRRSGRSPRPSEARRSERGTRPSTGRRSRWLGSSPDGSGHPTSSMSSSLRRRQSASTRPKHGARSRAP